MREIPLTQGKVALVDDEDYEWLSQFKWYANSWKTRTWYAVRHHNRKLIGMHRMILNPQNGEHSDHIDGNGLNNQRANLRLCDCAQNQHNSGGRGGSSRFKGVRYVGFPFNPWAAHIRARGICPLDLGCFATEEDAARAYDDAALQLHGEFARLNFPDGRDMKDRTPPRRGPREPRLHDRCGRFLSRDGRSRTPPTSYALRGDLCSLHCGRPATCRGLCQRCYQAEWKKRNRARHLALKRQGQEVAA